jgi:hypothetical protein
VIAHGALQVGASWVVIRQALQTVRVQPVLAGRRGGDMPLADIRPE